MAECHTKAPVMSKVCRVAKTTYKVMSDEDGQGVTVVDMMGNNESLKCKQSCY